MNLLSKFLLPTANIEDKSLSEEIQGITDVLGAEFFYHYKDVHLSKMIIVELIPNEKIVWAVKDNYFNFVEDKTEWKGTKIIFEISKSGDKTRLTFTHHGLVQAYECYKICSDSWTSYVLGSLKKSDFNRKRKS